MKPSRKFLFDTAFDFDERRTDAGQQNVESTYSADDLEAAKQSAYADGLDQATQGFERRAAQALEEIARQLATLHEAQAKSHETVQRNALEVAVSVVRKLFPGIEARDGLTMVENVVVDSLRQLLDEPRVVIRIHDSIIQALQDRLQQIAESVGFPGQLVLLGDDGLGLGDCRVEWADGGAERLSPSIWAEIDAAVERCLAGASDPPPVGTVRGIEPAGESDEAMTTTTTIGNEAADAAPS